MNQEIKIPSQNNFKPNWCYEFSIEFSCGVIRHANVYTCNPGIGYWTTIKNVDGIWLDRGKPIDFFIQNLNSWSAGCLGLRTYITGSNLSEFKSHINDAFYSCKEIYHNQLVKEQESALKAISELATYSPIYA